MQLSVGVLVIGSLYWRTDERKKWRHKRLCPDRDWQVRVPIRYGRLSKNGAYTMVFAKLSEDQFGQARVMQCQRPVTSPSDLVKEAEWLWSAREQYDSASLHFIARTTHIAEDTMGLCGPTTELLQ